MPKVAKELTDLEVRRLTHEGNKPKVHFVGGVNGLVLDCRPPVTPDGAGSRAWILRLSIAGKRRHIGLGSYPSVSVSQARDKAREIRQQAADGVDILAERAAKEAALRAARAKLVTFRQVAERWLNKRALEEKPAQVLRVANRLKTYAYPHLGSLMVGDIEFAHIQQVLAPIWQTKNETAHRVRLYVEGVLALATVEGLRTGDNPARWTGNLAIAFPKRSKVVTVAHHTALPYADMPGFWGRLHSDVSGAAADCLKLIILTATRSGEARGARWCEFDTAAKIWEIPAERTKSNRAHKVPLSEQVLALLETLPKGGEYLFPNRNRRPIGDAIVSRTPKKLGHDVTAHGFRATFRTWAQEQTSFPEEVAELSLAHVNTDATRAAYARGQMLPARAELMQAWATYCLHGTAPAQQPDNVLSLWSNRA